MKMHLRPVIAVGFVLSLLIAAGFVLSGSLSHAIAAEPGDSPENARIIGRDQTNAGANMFVFTHDVSDPACGEANARTGWFTKHLSTPEQLYTARLRVTGEAGLALAVVSGSDIACVVRDVTTGYAEYLVSSYPADGLLFMVAMPRTATDFRISIHFGSTHDPINDEVEQAFSLGDLPASVGQDVALATQADEEPSCGGGTNTVWFTFTPKANGVYVLRSHNSGHDTTLAIYLGPPDALTELGCNDDAEGTARSRLEVSLIAGEPYYVAAGAKGGAGSLQLSVYRQQTIAEDEAAGAIPIEFESLSYPGKYDYHTIFNTRSEFATFNPTDEPCVPSAAGLGTVWYRISMVHTGWLNVRTDVDAHATVSVFRGEPGSLTPVGCASFGSRTGIDLSSGYDYYLMVHGSFSLARSIWYGPFEDELQESVWLAHRPVVTGGRIGTTAGDDPDCAGGTGSTWFSIAPAFDDIFRFDTQGSYFDTAVGVYTGQRGSLTEVACADDAGDELFTQVDVPLKSGRIYWIMVVKKGSSSEVGFKLTVTPHSDVLFAEGFERLSSGSDGWYVKSSVGGYRADQKAGFYSGEASGGPAYLAQRLSPELKSLYVSGWFKRTQSSRGFLITFRRGDEKVIYGLRTSLDGNLEAFNGVTGKLTTSDVRLPLNVWTYLEVRPQISGAKSSIGVWLDGQPVGDLWDETNLSDDTIGIVNFADVDGPSFVRMDALALATHCMGSCPDFVPPLNPTVSVSPVKSTVNILLSTTLSGWAGSTDVQIRWKRTSGSTFVIATVRTDATGGWSGTLRVPATPGGSANQIQFVQGAITKTVAFEVVPRIKVTPDPAQRNQTVDVSLRGYGKQEVVRIRWKRGSSWEELATVTTSNTGSANVAIQVPSWAADGEHSVRGDGSTFRAQTNVVTVSGGGPVSGAEEPAATPTPTSTPTPTLTATATAEASPTPTAEPTSEPTAEPTIEPTIEPTTEPSPEPTLEPTVEPTAEVSPEPTATPTEALTPEA